MQKPNKHIMITGASSGIGQELAKQLARQGHRLSLIARRANSLSDLHTELGKTDSVLTLTADVTDFQKVKDSVKRAEELLGPIDIVIANAGVAYHVPSS